MYSIQIYRILYQTHIPDNIRPTNHYCIDKRLDSLMSHMYHHFDNSNQHTNHHHLVRIVDLYNLLYNGILLNHWLRQRCTCHRFDNNPCIFLIHIVYPNNPYCIYNERNPNVRCILHDHYNSLRTFYARIVRLYILLGIHIHFDHVNFSCTYHYSRTANPHNPGKIHL